MRTAIIGAEGYIGARIVESFHLGAGPAVVAVTPDPVQIRLAARFAVDLRVADPLDEDELTAALAGCAAAVDVDVNRTDAKRRASVFCRAATRAGLRRLVYLSSAAVHGRHPQPDTHEHTRPAPGALDEAAQAQAAAERQFFTECKRAGIAGYALRPAIVFGPRSPLLSAVIQELREERAWLLGTGDAVCNTVYLDNLVDAVRLCLRAKSGAGQPYIVGDAETITWRDWYTAIARELDFPIRRVRYVEAPPTGSDPARSAVQEARSKLSFSSAEKTLGYTPSVTFVEGVRRSCEWWRFAQGEFFGPA